MCEERTDCSYDHSPRKTYSLKIKNNEKGGVYIEIKDDREQMHRTLQKLAQQQLTFLTFSESGVLFTVCRHGSGHCSHAFLSSRPLSQNEDEAHITCGLRDVKLNPDHLKYIYTCMPVIMYRKHHHMDMATMPNGGVGGDPLRAARRSSTSSTSSSGSATRHLKSAVRKVDNLTTIRICASPPAKDVQEHRSRLLNRLGIYGKIPAVPATLTTRRTGGVRNDTNRPNKISESQQQDESSGRSANASGIEKSLQRAASYASSRSGTTSSTHSTSRQRRPSDCSTSSCTSSSAETIRRTSDDSVSLGQIPSCAYRIADVPRDPATVRKMNMLRSLGVGGIRSSADNLPRTAVPVCFDSSNGDMGTIVKGASRPQITDIQPLVEPLKYKEDEPTLLSSSALKLLNPIRRLSLASTCSTSASSIPSTTGSNGRNSEPPKSTKQTNSKKKRKSIKFAPSVSVVQIPMRTEYSSRIATRLWSSRTEIRDNANRNVIEFSAENCDWRNVVEDDGMFVCTVSGELVHPVHCRDYYKLNASKAAAAAGTNLPKTECFDSEEIGFPLE